MPLGKGNKSRRVIRAPKIIPASLDGRSIMYAIIENGNKQYKVAVGDVLSLEKLSAAVGEKVEFSAIFVSDESGIKTAGEAADYKVTAEVLAQDKAKKIIVYKYKAKKNERKKQGHRQPFTKIKVVDIAVGKAEG